MLVIGMLFSLVALVCGIIILVHAFKDSVGMGFLCLCVPFVIIWYAFAKFQHERKGLIIGIWLGAIVLSWVFQIAGGGFQVQY